MKLTPNQKKTCRLYQDVELAGGSPNTSAFLTLYSTDGSSMLSLCGWQCISPLRTATCKISSLLALPNTLLVVHLVLFLKEQHIVRSPILLSPLCQFSSMCRGVALNSHFESQARHSTSPLELYIHQRKHCRSCGELENILMTTQLFENHRLVFHELF